MNLVRATIGLHTRPTLHGMTRPTSRFLTLLRNVVVVLGAGLLLAACQSGLPKAMKPVPSLLLAKMKVLGMDETAPIFIRIFKEESQLEVWKQKQNGEYALLNTYGICRWSGEL